LRAVLAEAVFDDDVSPLDIAKVAQTLLEAHKLGRIAGRSAGPYPAHLRNLRHLLRTRRERPRGRRAAEKRG
jgi:hypothetical protein